MQFDARAAKLLQPGEHITIDENPGLRLEATQLYRTWTYRYKSRVDGRMRQKKLGRWPAMSLAAAIVQWEKLRDRRDAGEDPSLQARAERASVAQAEKVAAGRAVHTLGDACDFYLTGHIDRSRKPKGAAEIRRMFNTMLGDARDLVAATVTRSQAFALISSHIPTPVQASKLRLELGAAWDYCLDAGELPAETPNWWRLILRGKLRSKGRAVSGVKRGVIKRSLSPAEVGELIRWLPNFAPVFHDVVVLYLWTMARGCEIVAMRGDEVTSEASGLWWTIPKYKTKNSRHDEATDLRVPLVGKAKEVVLGRIKQLGAGHLFPASTKLGHIQQKFVQSNVYRHQPYCTIRPEENRHRLTVTHWAPHDLRRTSRTLVASLGCPKDIGEALLGHMLPAGERTYNRHSFDNERRVWLTTLSDHLQSLTRLPWP